MPARPHARMTVCLSVCQLLTIQSVRYGTYMNMGDVDGCPQQDGKTATVSIETTDGKRRTVNIDEKKLQSFGTAAGQPTESARSTATTVGGTQPGSRGHEDEL
jgi:hypothetical protein